MRASLPSRRVTGTLLVVVAVVVVLAIVRQQNDGQEPASGPDSESVDETQSTNRVEVANEDPGPVRMRWQVETDRGLQDDLVVAMDEDRVVRSVGSVHQYGLGAQSVICFPADDTGTLQCELAAQDTQQLVPGLGAELTRPNEAGSAATARSFAGRAASCRIVTLDTESTESCVDSETGVLVFLETIDEETGSFFRQQLVEWEPVTQSDLVIPPEADQLLR